MHLELMSNNAIVIAEIRSGSFAVLSRFVSILGIAFGIIQVAGRRFHIYNSQQSQYTIR